MKTYDEDYDDYATIGYGATIGEYVNIGKFVEIGDGVKIGEYARIDKFVEIGDGARIGKYVAIGDSAEIGDDTRIGNSAKIGDGARFGRNVEIGDYAKIGDGARFGDKFRCEGLEVIDFFTMSNVNGTGRRIYIYVHTKGITIRAGCFKGSLDEFCEKAEDEGKYLCSRTVRAAAEAFAAEIQRQGKTGGWDK